MPTRKAPVSVTPRKATKRSASTPSTATPTARVHRKPKAAAAGKVAPPRRRRTSRAPKPKGLEASYSGKIFRSRLEARWALFLDLLDINWDYEPCHYILGPRLAYLPDFYLPGSQLWLEVKGTPFMDAASMAKCVNSVAGPNKIPLREAPYTESDRLLLGGGFKALVKGSLPQHTLVTMAKTGTAAFQYVTLNPDGDGGMTLDAHGRVWGTMAATGAKATRRPTPAKLKALLEPDALVPQTPADARITMAYKTARLAPFNDDGSLNIHSSPLLIDISALRRSGRPLGVPVAYAA